MREYNLLPTFLTPAKLSARDVSDQQYAKSQQRRGNHGRNAVHQHAEPGAKLVHFLPPLVLNGEARDSPGKDKKKQNEQDQTGKPALPAGSGDFWIAHYIILKDNCGPRVDGLHFSRPREISPRVLDKCLNNVSYPTPPTPLRSHANRISWPREGTSQPKRPPARTPKTTDFAALAFLGVLCVKSPAIPCPTAPPRPPARKPQPQPSHLRALRVLGAESPNARNPTAPLFVTQKPSRIFAS